MEHPFRVIMRQFGYVKVRYGNLTKKTAQMLTLFALSNLGWRTDACCQPGVGAPVKQSRQKRPDLAPTGRSRAIFAFARGFPLFGHVAQTFSRSAEARKLVNRK